jgi:hypothetical protein
MEINDVKAGYTQLPLRFEVFDSKSFKVLRWLSPGMLDRVVCCILYPIPLRGGRKLLHRDNDVLRVPM